MKKAIVAVPYLSGKGGTETVIKNFYDAISKYSSKKLKWKLISFGGSKYSDWMIEWPKQVYYFSNNRLIQYAFYSTLLPFLIGRILKREKPNYFISTNPIIWSIAYKLRKRLSPNTKIISWYHYSFKMKRVKKRYLEKVDVFWAISNGIKSELISMGINPDKIDIIYNPIDINNKKNIRRSNNFNNFIYVGRIDYEGQKNVSELFKALGKLNNETWKCDLYGNIDTKTLRKLKNLKEKLNISNHINFHGFSENVWEKIKTADCLILTSKYEGFPMVLCEAACRGVSLISANCPTGVEDIVSYKNGFLYSPGNFNELAQILKNVIEKKKLPNQQNVINSMNSFSYKNYVHKILCSLDKIE